VLAADWLKREARRANWTDDYRQEVKASLDNHLSSLATPPVAEITTAIAARPIRKVEDSAPDMATKVRQRLRSIMDYAAAPHRAITHRAEVGNTARGRCRRDQPRRASRHLLAAFTPQRIGEIVSARWDEFDLQWSVVIRANG
jgi:integrase